MSESVAKTNHEPPQRNVGDVLEDALLQAKTLIQAELSLARHELSTEARVAFGSLLLLIVGVMLLQAALVTLGVSLLLAFSSGTAAALVVGALTAAGGTCALLAARGLGKRKLPRTTARLALDAKQVLETVK